MYCILPLSHLLIKLYAIIFFTFYFWGCFKTPRCPTSYDPVSMSMSNAASMHASSDCRHIYTDTHRQTERQTDRQTETDLYTLCTVKLLVITYYHQHRRHMTGRRANLCSNHATLCYSSLYERYSPNLYVTNEWLYVIAALLSLYVTAFISMLSL